jgi:dihydroorotate dehydrogenase electron transfer subunit
MKLRSVFTATVVANVPPCREHFKLVLRVSNFPSTQPGQFIQIAGSDLPEVSKGEVVAVHEWEEGKPPHLRDPELSQSTALLRRPFSLAGRRDGPEGAEIDIIHRVVGISTHYFSTLRPGDTVSVLGPLGNAFALPAAKEIALLVGGGVGIPPMIYLGARLAGRPAIAFSGALTRNLLPLTIQSGPYEVEEFSRHGIPTILTTDDGSYGFQGFVTQALEAFLDRQLAAELSAGDLKPVIYTCGPEPMMKRVADIALARNIECQIAVERAMACGMGTCQSCCIKVKKPHPAAPPLPGKAWCYRLACTDGPVFSAAQLLW